MTYAPISLFVPFQGTQSAKKCVDYMAFLFFFVILFCHISLTILRRIVNIEEGS